MNVIKVVFKTRLHRPEHLDILMDEIFNKSIADMVGSDYAITNPFLSKKFTVNIIEKENAFYWNWQFQGLEKSDFFESQYQC